MMLSLKYKIGLKSRGLKVNNMATVLIGLKSTSYFLAQTDISLKSWLMIPSISLRFEKNKELSSTNSLNLFENNYMEGSGCATIK